jgi:imidazolonepropionase-like amidohydrolase
LPNFWQANEHSHILTAKKRRSKDRSLERYLQLVRAMHRGGAQILPGTDTPNPFSFAGFVLHDELKVLVQVAFTPLVAVRAATRDSARFMRLLDWYGTAKPWKVADLLILDADPLKDINNVDKISIVVTRGRVFTKEELQSLLQPALE